jgi:hypothetical protein
VDGRLEAEDWEGIPQFDFIPHSKKQPLKKRTWMRIAYDEEALYIGLRCEEPNLDWLDTNLPRWEDIYYKDGFEIFLDPGAEVWRYWQFVFDTVPHQFQTQTRNAYAKKAAWQVAIGKGTNEWTAEVRFPFSEFDAPPPKEGTRWRLNIMRDATTFRDADNPGAKPAERSHFSPRGPLHNHHAPELFGDLYFGASP